jgi:hypothetical protein
LAEFILINGLIGFIGSVDGARITNARFWRLLPELSVQREQMADELQTVGQVMGDTVE